MSYPSKHLITFLLLCSCGSAPVVEQKTEVSSSDSRIFYTTAKDIKGRSPEETYSYYCSNGKQIRAFVENLEVELVEPSRENLALDEYQDKIKKLKATAREVAKNYFMYSTESEVVDDGLADGAEVHQSRTSNLIIRIKNRRIELNSTYSQLTSDFKILRDEFTFNFPKKAMDSIFEDTIENSYFLKECTDASDSNNGGYISLDENCKFKASKALADRERAWNSYLKRFTSVAEAPGRTPKALLFNVKLDLSHFCSYGIQLSDLKAR